MGLEVTVRELAVTAVMCACLLGASALGATADTVQEPHREMLLKVFLADFEDIPHPATYSQEYFKGLFFGLGEPRQTPEGRGLSGSVREYFLNVSEGRLDIGGEVVDWARLPGKITKIPHWKGGMEPFGESWPVIVAETLRANGIVGEDAGKKVLLADGRTPDLLVFLNTDWGVGGVNRGWGHLRDVLGIMKLSDLWDDAWTELPSPFSSFSLTLWRGAPASGPDGCIDGVPNESDLEFFPLSIMMHEMGHQLAGWPDLYGGAFEPWGVFDLMGGPAASTHYPMTASAYLRESSGWMQYTDMPRRTQRDIELRPLETHKAALRFPQGPSQESIVVENRAYLTYSGDFGSPPKNLGQRLLMYRLDPAARRIMMYGDNPVGKVTTMIRRPEHYGEMWGEGAATEVTADTTPSSRNSLGELWWEFRDIRPGTGDKVFFDAGFAPTDLIDGYTGAEWTDGAGEAIPAGTMGEPGGQAAIGWFAQVDGTQARRLLIRTGQGGTMRGRYHLPTAGPRRLYALVRLPDGAEHPVSFAITPVGHDDAGTEAELGPEQAGQATVIVAEIPAAVDDLDLVVRASGDQPASVEVEEAWLAGMPPTAADFAEGSPAQSALLRGGGWYGPRVMTIPLSGDSPETWTAEWPVGIPAAPATLRGLVGFTDDAPAGAKATVGIKLVTTDKEWPLLADLEVVAPAAEDNGRRTARANLLTVVEAPLPNEAAGTDARLVMKATSAAGEAGFRLAVPALRICTNRAPAP